MSIGLIKMTCLRKSISSSVFSAKIISSLLFILLFLFSSCVSSKIVISDEMMMPILDEEFEKKTFFNCVLLL